MLPWIQTDRHEAREDTCYRRRDAVDGSPPVGVIGDLQNHPYFALGLDLFRVATRDVRLLGNCPLESPEGFCRRLISIGKIGPLLGSGSLQPGIPDPVDFFPVEGAKRVCLQLRS